MANATVTFNMQGFEGLQGAFARYEIGIQDQQVFWQRVERTLQPSNAIKVFVQGQGIWRAYKNSRYRSWKHKHGYFLTKLRKTGKLYQGFSNPGSPFAYSDIQRDSWTYGVDIDHPHFRDRAGYPALHNVGGGKLPKREWAIISIWMFQKIHTAMIAYIESLMGRRSSVL